MAAISRLLAPRWRATAVAFLGGLAPPLETGARYGCSVQGPLDKKQDPRTDPSKLLTDPYACGFDEPLPAPSFRCSRWARTPVLARRKQSLKRRLEVDRGVERIAAEFEHHLRARSPRLFTA